MFSKMVAISTEESKWTWFALLQKLFDGYAETFLHYINGDKLRTVMTKKHSPSVNPGSLIPGSQ